MDLNYLSKAQCYWVWKFSHTNSENLL